ncbi:MAG: PepSY domain-containing protein [Paludibacteraceae bacterium]|nr:PepSY domain-containing protein [Paludibacteraceae bacterium]
MRNTFLFIHRWLGIVFGVFISVICLSGAVLIFSNELNNAANRISKPDDATPLTADELIEAVNRWNTDGLTFVAIQMPADDHHVAQAQFAEMGRNTIAVNPYTGEVLGQSGSAFVGFVKKLHRWLLMPPKDTHGGMSVGRIIVGSSAIAMTFILITGIIIWWPKNRKMLKARTTVRTDKGFRWFVYDSHVSVGIFAVIFLLLMSLTGPIFSFGWYRTAATKLAGGDTQEMYMRSNNTPQQEQSSEAQDVNEQPVQQVKVMQAGEQGNRPQGKLPVQVIFNRLHTGSIGGWLLRILYFLAALIGACLPWSGYYMFVKRQQAKQKSPRQTDQDD